MSAFREIEEQVKSLPPEERARLAESIRESLRQEGIAEIEAAWEQEIQARVAAYQRGEEVLIDAEAVIVELRQIVQ